MEKRKLGDTGVKVIPSGHAVAVFIEGPQGNTQEELVYPAVDLFFDMVGDKDGPHPGAPVRAHYKLVSMVWHTPKPVAVYYFSDLRVIQ